MPLPDDADFRDLFVPEIERLCRDNGYTITTLAEMYARVGKMLFGAAFDLDADRLDRLKTTNLSRRVRLHADEWTVFTYVSPCLHEKFRQQLVSFVQSPVSLPVAMRRDKAMELRLAKGYPGGEFSIPAVSGAFPASNLAAPDQ